MSAFSQLRSWTRRLGTWLLKPWPVWLGLAALAALYIVCAQLSCAAEVRMRYTGMLLELMGIWTVARGLQQTRNLFKKPSLRAALTSWLSAFPRWRTNTGILAGTAHMSLEGMRAQLSFTVGPPLNATIEQRVAALETNLQNVNGAFHASRREFEEKIATQETELKREQRERVEADGKLSKLLQEGIAGGLEIERLGLVLFILGLLFSTASTELARLFATT